MNLKSTFLLSACMLLGASLASGVPARRDLRTVTQPDGTTLQVRTVGDEHRHFLLTSDGVLLTTDESTGTIEYARINAAGAIESLGIKAADPARRSAADAARVQKLTSELVSRMDAAAPRRAPQNGMGLFTNNFPRKGSPKVLVILAEYKDVKFTTANPAEYFEAMLNEPGFSRYGGTGSCSDYFRDNSYGEFTPQFVLAGPVTLPNNRAYYGGNDAYGDDKAPAEMIAHACKALDGQIDFSEFDNDGDGVVDNVFVFYAGEGEASGGPAESVWQHSWELQSARINLFLDGVRINRYACSNEWCDGRPDGIGTFVHEFSHVMGLPDLYVTDYNESALYLTPGSYSVMDYGSYNNDGCTPPSYSIYERNALGWMEPEIIDGPCSLTIEEIQSSNLGFMIATDKENEFFLFENRQQTGWDKYLPGHGMLIWHIDFNQSIFDLNEVNNTASHQYVDIIEAGGTANNESAYRMAAYPWPGTARRTEFSATSIPAFKSWSGKVIDLPLTGITETDGVISFDVAGGEPVPDPIETPVAETPVESGGGYFVAWWNPVEGATDYMARLYQKGGGEPREYTADMGNGRTPQLPSGWSASAIAGYTTYGNYGEASPSFKLSTDGAWLQTSRFDDPVSYLSFWCKGQQASDSSLEILGLIDGKWQSLGTVTPEKVEVLTPEFKNLPDGVMQLKFVWHKKSGNLSLDDIVIRTAKADLLIKTVESTGGETSVRFDALPAGEYLYTVAATNGEFITRHSAPVYVTVSASGIEPTVTESAPAEYFDMLGRRVSNPAPGSIVIMKRGGNVSKIIVR